MNQAVVGYDITISYEDNKDDKYKTYVDLGLMLRKWCRKFVFQLEKGESGYIHWQCRVFLMKKKRMCEVLNTIAPEVKGNWSITSNNTHEANNFNYVMKSDTKIEGSWNEKDFYEPPIMTRQLDNFMKNKLRPWQDQVLKRIEYPDDRKIIMIWDTVGNSGKSIFSEYCEYHNLAEELPCLRSFDELVAFAMGRPLKKCYFVDMPRALRKDRMAEFYSGIECLKNGVLFDKRYKAQKIRFDRPNVIVFTNILPDIHFMSVDRWELYKMDEAYCLTKLDIFDTMIDKDKPMINLI